MYTGVWAADMCPLLESFITAGLWILGVAAANLIFLSIAVSLIFGTVVVFCGKGTVTAVPWTMTISLIGFGRTIDIGCMACRNVFLPERTEMFLVKTRLGMPKRMEIREKCSYTSL